ncbi:3-methyladenine DNA glycosylase [Luteococcus sp. Sow4_B9]|uniref:3-methyladenine DNA glycosylase n=1 Tax=Luteococcus sp. Sow4_B9 TaxID=3438792 RepID=UPI003F9C1C0B
MAATVLPSDVWHELADTHRERAGKLLAGVQERRRKGERHPVEDFLFDYYNLRPGELIAWHPGVGQALEDLGGEYAGRRFYQHDGGVSWADGVAFLSRRRSTVEWIQTLLSRTASNPSRFGCFGMHEWAMVYHLEPGQTRHAYLPLRFPPERIAKVVEEVGLRCSHFDAFRFFTPDAEPLNELQPTRELQPELDQPACLHANMDLYKWASKLVPMVDSALLLDTFVLARDIREMDMRASAYDLSDWGYPAVPVETAAGRAEYVRHQRAFAQRAEVLRERLLALVNTVLREDPALVVGREGSTAR